MRRACQLFHKCYFRCKGEAPKLISYEGSSRYELLETVRSSFAATFKEFTIDDLQFFNSSMEMLVGDTDSIFTDCCQTESNAVIIGLKPKKITIVGGSGNSTTYVVTSDANLSQILIKEGAGCLLSLDDFEIKSYKELKDGLTYTLRGLKITILDENSIEEKVFNDQKELANYLKAEKIGSLGTEDGRRVRKLENITDGSVLHKPKTITIVTHDFITKKNKTETQSFLSDSDLNEFLKGRKLSGIFETAELSTVMNFNSIKHNGTYYGQEENSSVRAWINNEMTAMEDEAALAAKAHISALLKHSNLDYHIVDKPRKFSAGGKHLQEWDGIFYSEAMDTLFILECKHSVTAENIQDIQRRVAGFMDMLRKSTIEEGNLEDYFKSHYREIHGILCGSHFPESLRQQAESVGLLTLVPSGLRYKAGEDWCLILQKIV
jgi:hypothetical protein